MFTPGWDNWNSGKPISIHVPLMTGWLTRSVAEVTTTLSNITVVLADNLNYLEVRLTIKRLNDAKKSGYFQLANCEVNVETR